MFQYVIVRSTRNLVEPEQADTVNAVYGPYDEQGASRAYRGLVAAGYGQGASNLHVRGLIATDEKAIEAAVIDRVRSGRISEIKPGTGTPIVGDPIHGSFTETVTR